MRVLMLDGHAIGFANFRLQLLRDFCERGHEVVVAAPGFTEQIRGVLPVGVRSIELPLDRGGLRVGKDLRCLFFLYRLTRDLRPECILTFSPKATGYGGLIGRILRVPVRIPVITGLGYGFVNSSARARFVRIVQATLYKLAFRGSRIVFFQNPDDLEFFRAKGLIRRAQDTAVIGGSGVDLGAYSQMPAPLKPGFLMVGRLLRSKGVVEYLQAAAIVRQRLPGVEFRLVGWLDKDNPDCISETELNALIDKSGVRFLGKMSDVKGELGRALVFVLPSYREGTPRSTLEALAVGRAVITTDAPGCRETVSHGYNGFLVAVGDIGALAEAMMELATDPELAKIFCANSRTMAEERFDVRKVNARILLACEFSTKKPG